MSIEVLDRPYGGAQTEARIKSTSVEWISDIRCQCPHVSM
jgi:hypothetical protein